MDDLITAAATRCPSCRASVRPDAPWCSLCHADLRPPPPAPAPPPPVAPPVVAPAAPVEARFDPLTAPAQALGLPASVPLAAAWPCARCGASNVLTDSTCVACGAGFLAGLRESEAPLLVVPGVGDITRLSRGQRLALAAAVVGALMLLVVLLGLLSS